MEYGWPHIVQSPLALIVIFQHVPYLIKNPEGGDHEGFLVDLLDEMNIDYELVIPEDNKYGYFNETTNKWTGMMGMVLEQVLFL